MAPRKKKQTSEGAALAVLTPDQVTAIVQERSHAELALQAIAASTLDTDEDVEGMTVFVRALREKRGTLESQLAAIIDPLKASTKAAKAVFDPPISLLKAGEDAGKLAIDTRFAAQRAAQDAAMVQMAAAGATPVREAVLSTATGQANLSLPEGTHSREYWGYSLEKGGQTLTDAAVLSYLQARGVSPATVGQVMVELGSHFDCGFSDAHLYLSIDEKALASAAREKKGELKIAGVTPVRTERTVVV